MSSDTSPSANNPEEISFNVKGRKIAGQRWNKGGRFKAIALHGWLDNCSSFELIGPEINDIELVALDAAGHGRSDFRSEDSDYLIWAEVSELFEVADILGWQTFNLIGHSRGACISTISSGTFPERIERLVLIEGGVPLPMEPKDVPENLAAHIKSNKKLSGAQGTLFKTREEAISARADGFTKISHAAAELLASRSLGQDSDGFFMWRADARLKAPSSLKLTHAQIDAFLGSISAPTLLIEGDQGILKKMPFMDGHLESIDNLKRVLLKGGHHLHMEEAAPECSLLIREFICD